MNGNRKTGNHRPLISVVVITHNNEKHISQCLDSLLGQTLQPGEIVICDDASKDGTRGILGDYAERYPEIVRLVEHSVNAGIPANLNSGFRVAKGDYISLIAGDDIWLPEKLEKEYQRLQETGAAWVYSKVVLYWDDLANPTRTGEFWGTTSDFEGDVFENVLRREMSLRNWLLRRDALEALGFFDECVGMYEDWDFNLRMSKRYPIAHVRDRNVVYLIHGGGEHHAPMYRQMAEVSKVLRKNAALIPEVMSDAVRETIQRCWPESAMLTERDKAAYKMAIGSLDLPYIPAKIESDGEGLVFLVSLPRSGSTMLQRVLGSHPDIHTAAEPWVMLNPLYALKQQGASAEYDAVLCRQAMGEFLEQLPGGEENYYDSVRQMGKVLYSRAVRFSGKSRFLDKTPRYFYILTELVRTYPKAKIVLLLRNPLAVLASVLGTWFHKSISGFENSSHYKDMVEGPALLAQAIEQFGDSVLVTHYEEYTSDCEGETARICEFLGLPYFPPMLEYGQNPAPSGTFGDPERINLHSAPVDTYANTWKDVFDTDELHRYALSYVERLDDQVLNSLGYPKQELLKSLSAGCASPVSVGEEAFIAGDYKKAEDCFLREHSLCPENIEILNNLVVLYWQKGDAGKSLDYLADGLSLNKTDRNLIINGGKILIELGQVDEARQLYSGYLATSPDDADVVESLSAISSDKRIADGESAFAQGNINEAIALFEEAVKIDPTNTEIYNNLGVACWEIGDPGRAIAYFCEALERDPGSRDAVINGAKVLVALDQKKEAQALCLSYLKQFPDDNEVSGILSEVTSEDEGAESEPAKNSSASDEIQTSERASGKDILVATSIAPKSLDKQKSAIDSWLKLGMEVISLNIQSEIDVLADHFPGVRFVRANRDGKKRLGKPYVYINDIFSVLRKSGKPVVGVINSDIILRSGEELNALLSREAKGSLLYASRIDIDREEDEDGRFYHRGFDLFFMDRDVIRDIPDNRFMLGMPWWDYWFPCLMLTKGVTVKRINNPGAYHLWHKPNYSTDNSVSFGADFVEVFAGLPFMHLHNQSIEAGLGGFRFSVLSDCALYHAARNSQTVSLPAREGERTAVSGNPKVTAIVSTYASEEFIEECLQDLVNQTIVDELEILVIDAASPQNERAVVEKFQLSHSNIRYHRTPERIGIYAAWNLAVEMAHGDYLISCSTNDRLRGDACEILSRSLDDQPDIALVYGNSFLTKDPHRNLDNAELSSMYIWPEYRYETLLDRSMVGPHPMWRRSVHETVGRFDESLLALGDQDFWIRLGEQHKLLALPDFTGLYLVSDDSLTGNTDISKVEEDFVHMRWSWRHRYEKWFKSRLEVPETVRCQEGPPVQIILRSDNGDTNGIADTLDSVAEQAYSNWKLAVVSEEPCPDSLFDEHPQLAWIQGGSGSANDECIDALLGSVTDDSYLVFMQAGERLDALFLSDACAGLEQHPEWMMLYCDDDCVASDGELTDPRFKPDFNLDLLRGSDYVGNACVFRAEAVKVIGETGASGDARAFDLLLRIFDQFGRDAIGHLAEMRFHRSVSSNPTTEASIEFRRRAVQAHLDRCGEQALIEDAVIPGTFMLSYVSDKKPRVSILVVASDSGGGVGNIVHSIVSKTDYPDYEIRILVGPSVPVAVIDRLQVLQKETPFVHLERCANKVSPAALNQLARDCSGDLLLWLNENTLVLQKEWLARLVATGLRDSVGVVGVRAVNRKKTMLGAGVIPGIGGRGAGSGMLSGLHMTSEGYMGRAQLSQETGAVSPLCMLVSKEDFSRAGEFDTALAVDLYRSIDFCERIRAEGLQVVWTPHVTLMYLGAIGAIDGEPESEEQVDRETELLHERWLGKFAREPVFNRHLSLSRSDYGLDTAIPAAWNPDLDSLPRVLSFGVGSLGSWQYRVRQPLNAMQGEGLIQRIHTELASKKSVVLPTVVDLERLQPTTLLMHNTMHDDYIKAMEDYKRINNAFIVFGQDDLMTALPPKNPFSKTVYKDMKQRVRRCLSLADRLVVTTEPLAQALEGMAGDIIVVPNAIDENIWSNLVPSRGAGRKPRVGWAGAQQHLGDLEMLETVVRELADEVEWVFFGMCPPALLPWVSEVHQAVDFELYPEKLASLNLDLALAPLERNRFNESKSNLRVLEYGVLGWPVIATDIHPYQSAPVCRVPNQPRAWINAIRERIHDCDALAHDGDQLREWVHRNAMLGQQFDAWMLALNLAQSSAELHHHHGHAANL